MAGKEERVTGGMLASDPPHGLLRLGFRLPIWLYRLRLGRLLGRRLVMITHTGRQSGQPRRTVLEVVRYNAATREIVIASGYGEKSDWFRNIMKTPQVTVNISHHQFRAEARRLPKDAAAAALCDYADHHPVAYQELVKLMTGKRLGSAADCGALAEVVPVVSLMPLDAPRPR